MQLIRPQDVMKLFFLKNLKINFFFLNALVSSKKTQIIIDRGDVVAYAINSAMWESEGVIVVAEIYLFYSEIVF